MKRVARLDHSAAALAALAPHLVPQPQAHGEGTTRLHRGRLGDPGRRHQPQLQDRVTNLLGRIAEVRVRRNDKDEVEPVEIVAVGYAGGANGGPYWQVVVATYDGTLLSYDLRQVKLAPSEHPYRRTS